MTQRSLVAVVDAFDDTMAMYEVAFAFQAEDEGELSVVVGETLRVAGTSVLLRLCRMCPTVG